MVDEEAIELDMEEDEDAEEVEVAVPTALEELGQSVPTLVLTITPADLQSEMAKLMVPVVMSTVSIDQLLEQKALTLEICLVASASNTAGQIGEVVIIFADAGYINA